MKRQKALKVIIALAPLSLTLACSPTLELNSRVVPAQEYANAVQRGKTREFTIFESVDREQGLGPLGNGRAQLASLPGSEAELRSAAMTNSATGSTAATIPPLGVALQAGDPRFVNSGYRLAGSYVDPQEPPLGLARVNQGPLPPPPLAPPPGSSAPYLGGQMTANPSLWPDEAQGASLFRDHRAFQAMDIITVMVSESATGKRKADTKTEGKLTLTAAISKLFGLEKTALDNKDLDPTALINATSENKWDGKGETKREGELKAKMSAIILEVLPNGLLRVEGTKIISVNSEEEILVLSGLARPRDVDAANRIDSDRIANMRIDFYGRGVVSDKQSPGWGVRIFDMIWPF